MVCDTRLFPSNVHMYHLYFPKELLKKVLRLYFFQESVAARIALGIWETASFAKLDGVSLQFVVVRMTSKGIWGSSATEPREDTCVWELLGVGNRLLEMWFPIWSSLFCSQEGNIILSSGLWHAWFLYSLHSDMWGALSSIAKTDKPVPSHLGSSGCDHAGGLTPLRPSLSPGRYPFFVCQAAIYLIIFTC